MTSLTLPYPPSGNRYWRHARGRTYLSAEARAYRAAVARAAPVMPLDGPVSVRIAVYRPRKAGDLDNTFKVLLDALNGLAWHDDSQIEELHGYRHDDKDAPRVEVEVKRIPTRLPTAKTARSRCAVDGCRAKRYAGTGHCKAHVGFATGVIRAPRPHGNTGRLRPVLHPAAKPTRHRKATTYDFVPPRPPPVDAQALAAETFAPPQVLGDPCQCRPGSVCSLHEGDACAIPGCINATPCPRHSLSALGRP